MKEFEGYKVLLADDEQIDLVAKRLLEEYRPAFLTLANGDSSNDSYCS